MAAERRDGERPSSSPDDFSQTIGEKAARKIRAEGEEDRSVWHGLGAFGMIGWTVAAPTVLGVALGLWLDAQTAGDTAWTLILLALGLAVGCLSAWQWVERERKDMEKPE
jgi:ATP synthase protein I